MHRAYSNERNPASAHRARGETRGINGSLKKSVLNAEINISTGRYGSTQGKYLVDPWGRKERSRKASQRKQYLNRSEGYLPAAKKRQVGGFK